MYDTMYRRLFSAVTDVIEILQAAQIDTEETYINLEEPKLVLLKPEGDWESDDE